MNALWPKMLFLALCLATKPVMAGPLTSHDDLVHDLAHYGAGTIVAESVHFLARKSSLKPWQKFTAEVVASCVLNIAYECVTEKSPGLGAERVIFGTLGAVALGLQIDLKWYSRKKAK